MIKYLEKDFQEEVQERRSYCLDRRRITKQKNNGRYTNIIHPVKIKR